MWLLTRNYYEEQQASRWQPQRPYDARWLNRASETKAATLANSQRAVDQNNPKVIDEIP
jgi:hypothetical protein